MINVCRFLLIFCLEKCDSLLGRFSRLLKIIHEGGYYFEAKGFSKNRPPDYEGFSEYLLQMIRCVWSCVSYMNSVLFYEGHAMFKSLIEKKIMQNPKLVWKKE